MNDNSEEDLKLDTLMQSWSVPDCAPDFASRIVARALDDRVVGLPVGRRRLLVPLLLAACLLSAGAFAGFEAYLRHAQADAPVPPATKVEPTLTKTSRVSIHVVSAAAHAEPETATASPSDLARRRTSAPPPEQRPDATPEPQRPQSLHLPRCECGISAIVCSCSD